MIRRSILPHPFPVLLLLAFSATVVALPARSQDRDIQERLDRVERDLSMLQRQVYRGGPAQVTTPGPAAVVDTELRMDRLEAQMRELTGRVESEVNAVEQLQRRLEQINSDLDVRFSQAQAQPRNAPSNSHAAAGFADSNPTGPIAMRTPPPSASSTRVRPGELMPPGTLVPPPDPPTGVGTLTPPGPNPPRPQLATNGSVGALHAPSPSSLPSGSTTEQYSAAYGLLKQADYPAAEEALKAFIAQHPKDPLAGSAQYWLGETYYVRGRYAEAAGAFAEGYKNYPKGAKAPDDLLKLAMSLAHTNQKQNACLAFAQLDHDFPRAGSAIKERAAAEKKRLGC